MSLIGGLLNKAGDRKHDLNVSEAGKTQITLNTASGQQIQLAMDTKGNVFAISNGIIYPIGQNVVSQAKEYVLNQQPGYMDYIKNKATMSSRLMLSNYNNNSLKSFWDKDVTYDIIKVTSNKKMYLSEVLEKYDIRKDQLFFRGRNDEVIRLIECDRCLKYLENKKRFRPIIGSKLVLEPRGYAWTRQIQILNIIHTPRGTFSAGWFIDSNKNNEAEFNEFQDIRRNFYQNESFIINCGLYTHHSYHAELKIFEQASGNLIYTDYTNDNTGNPTSVRFNIPKGHFNPGIYTYYISLTRMDDGRELQSFTDKFQILSVENATQSVKKTSNSSESNSKPDAISELIQLLKEGKISEETFKVSMEALDNK